MDKLTLLALISVAAAVAIAYLVGRLTSLRNLKAAPVSTPKQVIKPTIPITLPIESDESNNQCTPLIPGVISGVRKFKAWDLPNAPNCTIYAFKPGTSDRINANEDLIAWVCPMFPTEHRDSVYVIQKDDKSYKYREMVGKPDNAFHVGTDNPDEFSDMYVVEAKSRKLLNKPMGMDFWRDIYQVTIAAKCAFEDPDCDQFQMAYYKLLLRYADCVVEVEYNMGVIADVMKAAPIAKRLAMGEPKYISSTKLAHYCVTGLVMNLGTTGVHNKKGSEIGMAFHEHLLKTDKRFGSLSGQKIDDEVGQASNVQSIRG